MEIRDHSIHQITDYIYPSIKIKEKDESKANNLNIKWKSDLEFLMNVMRGNFRYRAIGKIRKTV